MIGPGADRRVRRSHVEAWVAWAVVAWAATARFAPGATWGTELLAFLAAGAVAGVSPWRPFGPAWLARALVSAVVVALVGMALALGTDALGAARPSPGETPHAPGPAFLASLHSYLPWAVLLVVLLSDLAALRRLGRLLRSEALKTRKSRLFCAGLVATALVTLFAAMTGHRGAETSGWSVASGSFAAGLWAGEVFLLVLGATALAGEATGGTLKMMLPHAYRRSDWIVAKALVLLGATLLFGLVAATVSLGHAAAVDGLGDVVQHLEPMFGEPQSAAVQVFAPASEMASHAVEAVLAGLGALAVTSLVGLAISAVFDSVVAALSTAFLVFAGLRFADVLLRLPRDVLQGIYTGYPDRLLELQDKIGRALSERWDPALLGAGLATALVTGAALLLLATRVFARRDIHA